MSDYDILIDDDGAHFVYNDDLAEVFVGDAQETRRASHVEPAATVSPGTEGWIADMRPSGGKILTAGLRNGTYCESLPPFLDGLPFATRAAALLAEREWLRRERNL